MKYIYRFAKLPCSFEIRRRLNSASGTLVGRLARLDPTQLKLPSYNHTYLRSYQDNLVSVMQKNTYILGHALRSLHKPLSEVTLIDYGGGPGILSMLAKEVGIGTVVYNDINKDSCDSAQVVSKAVGSPCDHFVHGAFPELLGYLEAEHFRADSIVSSNVIEHVYDIEDFFSQLPLVGNGAMTVVMSTRANDANRRIRDRYRARQVRFELKGPNGATAGYLAQRKQIIRDWAPDLEEEYVNQLAIRTRGLIEPDIAAAVDRFRNTNQLPTALKHPTNTCCPLTGNWAEHLMDPFEIAEPLKRHGFETNVLSGYYSTSAWINLGDFVRTIVNCGVRTFNSSVLCVAPFYTIYAVR